MGNITILDNVKGYDINLDVDFKQTITHSLGTVEYFVWARVVEPDDVSKTTMILPEVVDSTATTITVLFDQVYTGKIYLRAR